MKPRLYKRFSDFDRYIPTGLMKQGKEHNQRQRFKVSLIITSVKGGIDRSHVFHRKKPSLRPGNQFIQVHLHEMGLECPNKTPSDRTLL